MKKLFNFYLDDDIKVSANLKITRLAGEENKGQLASLIRTLLYQFVNTPDEKVDKNLLLAMKEEYVLNATSNKRSRM